MKINFNNNNVILSAAPDGHLDTTIAPEFESFHGKNYDGTRAVFIDCEKVSYIGIADILVIE